MSSESDDSITGQVMPFGQYKGQPLEVLNTDDSYRNWILAQPWMQERWPVVYNFLVHGGPPPQDSAEHNEMQARFLEEDWCLKLMHCYPGFVDHGYEESFNRAWDWKERQEKASSDLVMDWGSRPPSAKDIKFENSGWDVTFNYEPFAVTCNWKCVCGIEPEDKWQGKVKNHNCGWETEFCWRNRNCFQPSKPYERRPSMPVEPVKPKRTGVPLHQEYLYPSGTWLEQQSGTWLEQQYKRELADYPVKLAEYRKKLAGYPAELAEAERDNREKLAGYERDLAEYREQRHWALDHPSHENVWRVHAPRVIAAELKPDLGDDYPTVLRQVLLYLNRRQPVGRGEYVDVATCEVAFTVVRRAQFRAVTWEQVKKIFATSGINLVMESELQQ